MIQVDDAIPSLPEHLQVWQQTLQWQPSPDQQQLFQAVYAGILLGNQRMNLTRITKPCEFWEKHLWDSLSALRPWLQPMEVRPEWAHAQAVETVIDIGTGAGFPGLPAVIACPNWQVTLLDATQKKILFLQELAQSLGCRQVKAIADRAEFLAHQLSHREYYDLALIRAVGSVATCAEYALPLIKVGGIAVLYRGQWTEADSEKLAHATDLLGGSRLAIQAWQTPLTQGTRHCIYLKKQQRTEDAFPRAVGLPAKQPLA